MVKIIVDSTCDLPLSDRERLDIEILPLTLTFGEEVYRDTYDITKEEFFNKLSQCKTQPTTSQISPAAFLEAFQRLGADGSELLVITISKNLSGTYQSACIAAEQYPGKVRVVDSSLATTAFALLTELACRKRDEGLDADSIGAYLDLIKQNLVIVCCMNSLENLHKGGRLPASVTILGGMLNIKPVVLIQDGTISILHKARGMKAAVQWMVDYVANQAPDTTLPIGFIHSANPQGALQVQELFGQRMAFGEAVIQEIGAVIGTHIGAGCVAIACFWKA